jgi:hypothetical protein
MVKSKSITCQACSLVEAYRTVKVLAKMQLLRTAGVPVSFNLKLRSGPIAVAARSKPWVCGRSLAGIAGSNPARGMDVCLL